VPGVSLSRDPNKKIIFGRGKRKFGQTWIKISSDNKGSESEIMWIAYICRNKKRITVSVLNLVGCTMENALI